MGTYVKNSAGVFLKSGGKLFKQNYNIGKGFRGTSAIYGTTKLRGLSLSTQYSIEVCLNRPTYIQYGGVFKLTSISAVLNFNNWDTTAQPSFHCGAVSPANQSRRVNNYLKTWMCFNVNGSFATNSDSLVYANSANAVAAFGNNTNYPVLNGDLTSLVINSTGYHLSTGASTARGNWDFYEFRLFDCLFINSEIVFNANNGTFNDPFSNLALKLWYKFELAEILDFSDALDGSDMRIGIRDFSGNNRHLELIGLPAGTTQEKLDYANANLFVTY